MAYFKNVNTLEELRKQYKELLKMYHPDNGGNVADMQNINIEYEQLFKILKNKHEKTEQQKKDNKSYTNNYDWENDKVLREILQKIINFSDIVIDIIGCFIWVDGNTYQYKEALKEIGFKWNGNRKKWFWHNGEYRKHSTKNLSYADIQNLYGSTEVKTERQLLLKQA